MAMTPEKLIELKKLEPKELMLLNYELSLETHETLHGKDGRPGLVDRVEHLERFKTRVKGAWAGVMFVAAAVGLKIAKGVGGAH